MNVTMKELNDMGLTIDKLGCISWDKKKEINDIVIPDTVDQKIVYGIKDLSHSNIQSIKLPDKLRVLSEKSFFECENLREIIIPSGVTEIHESAFERCKKLNIKHCQ